MKMRSLSGLSKLGMPVGLACLILGSVATSSAQSQTIQSNTNVCIPGVNQIVSGNRGATIQVNDSPHALVELFVEQMGSTSKSGADESMEELLDASYEYTMRLVDAFGRRGMLNNWHEEGQVPASINPAC